MRARLSLLALLLVGGCAPSRPPAAAPSPAHPKAAPAQLTGIDFTNLDRSVSPCDDFYAFACGGWLKRTEIPADRSQWSAFSEIEERNLALLRRALEADARGEGHPDDAYRDKLGRFWSACMDERQIEATAPAELRALLERVDRINSINGLARVLAFLHLGIAGALFQFGSQQDFKDATQVIGGLDQGGLGLPDRDYYLKDDPKFKTIRQEYQTHIAKMLELAGAAPAQAASDARTVLRIEHSLAQASLSRVERRDPRKIYHRLDFDGIAAKAPHFPWALYLRDLGHPDITAINVAVPQFFATVDGLLQKVSLADWRTYLRWQTINGVSSQLSNAFVDESFRFYGHILNGQKELPPRWKRCVDATDSALGEALAQPFVRETFGADGKRTTEEMVRAIEAAMQADLEQLDWMDVPTRAAAQAKLAAIANKIGYPARWRNYDALEIGADSYLANAIRAARFESHRDLDKIGKPLDRSEWLMTPPTVNAYYDPSMNEMVFPAGILQPPFFLRSARQAVNFGAIGMVMGHELTHGFDDEGRQFDAQGNLREWWTAPVAQDFDRRAECVAKQYDGYVAVDDLHLNGRLTLGENIADLGGIRLAYRAFLATQAASPPATPPTGEFNDEKLFFLGTAQAWCAKIRDENARVRVTTDPHSPPRFRVDGALANLPEFAAAFHCPAGSPMVRAEPCSIW